MEAQKPYYGFVFLSQLLFVFLKHSRNSCFSGSDPQSTVLQSTRDLKNSDLFLGLTCGLGDNLHLANSS